MIDRTDRARFVRNIVVFAMIVNALPDDEHPRSDRKAELALNQTKAR